MSLQFTDANFEEEVEQSSIPVLVDFWAPWCGPCKMIGPIIDQIATEMAGTVKVGKVDVEQNQGVASKYGVRSIPTMIIIKDGQILDTIVGATSKDNIVNKLKAAL